MGRRLTNEDDVIIRDLYINEKMSSMEIGRILNTSHRTVLNHLENMGIQRRTLQESQYAHNNKELPEEFFDYDTMYDLYVTKHITKEQLGKMFDCAPHVFNTVLKNLDIPIRGSSEAKIGVQRGDQHHNWKGGITSLNALCREYFQKNISPKIRERDNYTCQICGSHSNLHVHHKKGFSDILNEIITEYMEYDVQNDKDKLYEIIINDNRFTDESNLITLCKTCHLFIVHGYNKTIRSEALYHKGTFNDYFERKYIQVNGNGGHPILLDGDIV